MFFLKSSYSGNWELNPCTLHSRIFSPGLSSWTVSNDEVSRLVYRPPCDFPLITELLNLPKLSTFFFLAWITYKMALPSLVPFGVRLLSEFRYVPLFWSFYSQTLVTRIISFRRVNCSLIRVRSKAKSLEVLGGKYHNQSKCSCFQYTGNLAAPPPHPQPSEGLKRAFW